MATDGWIPEIVIGVDFGMTCTGGLTGKPRMRLGWKRINAEVLNRCRVLNGTRLAGTQDPPALAWQDDQ